MTTTTTTAALGGVTKMVFEMVMRKIACREESLRSDPEWGKIDEGR